jgi:hypothetical protein
MTLVMVVIYSCCNILSGFKGVDSDCNPLGIQQKLQDFVGKIIEECMKSLRCFPKRLERRPVPWHYKRRVQSAQNLRFCSQAASMQSQSTPRSPGPAEKH